MTTIVSLALSRPMMTEAESNSACRQQLDPFVFNTLKMLYGQQFQEFWDSYTIPKQSDKAIVIVERRAHPNLQFCLQNAVYFCRGYALHIFCSRANFEFVKLILGKQLENVYIHIAFETIGTAAQGLKEYNDLLKTKRFWNSFSEEHVVTLETDSYFRKPLPESIYAYDYVASRWPWMAADPGGGGLSYRKRSKMLAICDVMGDEGPPAQDAYASDGVKKLGLKFPSQEENLHFFTECEYSPNSIGTHQWWTYCTSPPSGQINEVIHNVLLHLSLEI